MLRLPVRLPLLAVLVLTALALTAGCGRSAPRICVAHGDCDPGESCVAERCRVAGYACEADAQCPGDEICVERACVEAPECLEDAACGPDLDCVAGACLAPCGGDAGCEEPGTACASGYCRSEA